MSNRPDYDAVVVGASLAGCTSAIALARQGARVALVERRTDPAAFKRVCGHYIQPSAIPTVKRLGLLEGIERAGAARGGARIWTRYGWIDPGRGEGSRIERGGVGPALSLRREVLDPIVRRAAAETDGVELMLGHTLEGLELGRSRATATLRPREGKQRELTASVLVGADGRGSSVARLAGLRTWTSRNDRFGYWSYFKGPSLGTGAGVHIWFTEPDVAIATPTDDNLMLYAAFPHRSRLAEFKRDTETALRSFMGRLPDAPPIGESERVGPIVGKIDLTNEWRAPVGRRIALVGDAALAADPVGAIGCGWAFQSGEWLAEAVGPALTGNISLSRGLRAYRRRHRRGLLGHSLVVAGSARADKLSPVERLMFSAAVRDPVLAAGTEAFAARAIGPREYMSPRNLARAAGVRVRVAREGGAVPVAG